MTKLFKTKHTNKNLTKVCSLHRISITNDDLKIALIVNGFGEIKCVNNPELDSNSFEFINIYQEVFFKIIEFWQELSRVEGFSMIQITKLALKRKKCFAKIKIHC